MGGEKSEEKKALDSEKRQMNYGREQTVMGGAVHPSDDQTYIGMQDTKSDLLKWQQDLGDELIDLVHTIRNEYQDVSGNWTIKKDALGVMDLEPLANDVFIYEVLIPQCKPFLSRNLINSNFDEKRILQDLKNTMNDITGAVADGHDRYGIKFTNYDLVLRLIKNTIKSGAFRALNGWTKKTDSTMIKRIESQQEINQQDDKRKLFGLIS